MKATPLLGLILSASFGCAPQGQAPPPNPSEVEAAARRFLDYAHAFDYAAMRAIATPDCEILLDGRRMDLDGFEAFLREMEKNLGGEKLGTYDLLDLNTKIVGDVAYTSWRSTNG